MAVAEQPLIDSSIAGVDQDRSGVYSTNSAEEVRVPLSGLVVPAPTGQGGRERVVIDGGARRLRPGTRRQSIFVVRAILRIDGTSPLH